MCREGYSSHANFIDRHSDVTAACDILIPASIPVVLTLRIEHLKQLYYRTGQNQQLKSIVTQELSGESCYQGLMLSELLR